ncbi:acyl-CoA dehydrogenase [Embleya sp. AB8]|uniref:acyl-CoA dehydrogenase family protein n=1 Tax=Embleya sp. AB8 TaxID=3156304 RepID=UPI003C730A60
MTDHAFPDPAKLLADALFDLPEHPGAMAGGPARDTLTYHRVHRLHEQIAAPGPLLHQPAYLRELLELSAMVDPGVFHVLFLHHCMTLGAALDFGASDADLAELAAGRTIGAALMTEVGQGNSSADIRTEAVWDPAAGEFVLHTPDPAASKYPPNVGLPGIARLAVVSARIVVAGTGHGTGLFLVPLRDAAGPGRGVVITPRPPTGLLPLDYASVRFDRVRVPGSRWLRDGATISAAGEYHDPLDPPARTRRSQGMSRFAWGAVSTGLAAVARAGAAVALAHACRRRTAGRLDTELPVLAYRNQQRALFGALAAALAATVSARRATDLCWQLPTPQASDRGLPAASMRTAALIKVTADRLAEQAISRCRRACGAFGFFAENRLIDYQGLALAFNAAGGDNELILLDAAWAMATGADYEPPEIVAQFGSPLARTGWVGLFRTRERLLYDGLVEQLRTGAEQGLDPFAARNECTDSALRLAAAHAARITIEALDRDLRSVTGPYLDDAATDDLCLLWVLDEVAAHDGWFLTEGLLTADEVRTLPGRIDGACARLAAHVPALLDMLDIPPGIIRGALAGDDPTRDLTTGPTT